MAQRYELIEVSQLPPGSARVVEVEGRALAVFNVGGTFHVLDNACPHRGGPLGDGRLDAARVSCPWHGWQFDVTTGEYVLNPELKVAVHPTSVEGGKVVVEL